MSLGVKNIEDDVLAYLDENHQGMPAEIAWWRFQHDVKPLLSIAEVGDLMLHMEARGLITFTDGTYKKVSP